MITPGLLRRSLLRAGQWRLIALQLCLLGLAGWIGVHPWLSFFLRQLDLLPGSRALAAALGSHGVIDLALRLSSPESWHPEVSFASALLLTVLCGPLFAGAALEVARSDETVRSRELLAGAGHFYGRMFRMLFAGLIPLGVAGGAAALLFKHASKVGEAALTEGAATRALHLALALALFLWVVASVWLDAARALFVAQPARRSAFFAVFAGGLLLLRRPLRSLLIGLVTLGCSGALAAGFVVARQQVVQGRVAQVLLAFALSQLGLAWLAWGRAARLIAFVELARADALARARPAGTFEMAPPRTSPPPPAPLEEPAPFFLAHPDAAAQEPAPGEAALDPLLRGPGLTPVASDPNLEIVAVQTVPVVAAPLETPAIPSVLESPAAAPASEPVDPGGGTGAGR